MSDNGSQRRLSAILSADVVGYSRLMAQNDRATVDDIGAVRGLVGDLVRRYQGRVVDSVGDNVLAEFSSIVEALNCAVALQGDVEHLASDQEPDRAMRLRIGLNLGDVLVKDGHLYGDGVNVAARLEGLAAPGGISLSGAAFEQVRNKVDVGFRYRGDQQVKNIADPIPVYDVDLSGEAPGRVVAARPMMTWVKPALVASSALVLLVVAAWSLMSPTQTLVPISGDIAQANRLAYPLPNKPSLVVLPFEPMGDVEELFSVGMTDDLITDLSRIKSLFVIARNSAFAFRDREVPLGEIAEQLGVQYVLDGTIRQIDDRVRINARLVDTAVGGQLWAGRYDVTLTEVFTVQDSVTEQIINALSISLTPQEAALTVHRETDNPQAHAAFVQGWSLFRENTIESLYHAAQQFERAIELDPDYGRAHAGLAAAYQWSFATNFTHAFWRFGESFDTLIARIEAGLKKAEVIGDPLVHLVRSRLFLMRGLHNDAIDQAGKALSLDPNDPIGYEALANALIFNGDLEQGLDMIRIAMRLDPQYPAEYLYVRGLGEYSQRSYEKAATSLSEAVANNPRHERYFVILAAAQGQLGRLEEAKNTVRVLNALRAERDAERSKGALGVLKEGVDSFLAGPYSLDQTSIFNYRSPRDLKNLRDGLVKAGVEQNSETIVESPVTVAGATTVSTAEVQRLIEQGAALIDVRSVVGRRLVGWIPGAHPMDLREGFTEAAVRKVATLDQPIIIHCLDPKCLRSSIACERAVEWGYKNVYYYRKGFNDWKAAGLPITIVGPGGMETSLPATQTAAPN